MVGDDLLIDPTDALLVAACDGEVVSLHAGHAVTLRTPDGIELLMHVGIDTVTVKGEGFSPACVTRDTPNRDSLACDLMEPVRPLVDAYVFDWMDRGPLRREWFFE
jgi:phosphoenolpyruvate-dependent sugar phosphotransferase system EIIA component/CRISPR associated protein, Cas1 family